MRSLWNWTGRLAILIALLPMLAVPATAVAQGEGSTAGEEKSEEESGTKSEAGGASEEVAASGFDTGDTAWMMVSCALVGAVVSARFGRILDIRGAHLVGRGLDVLLLCAAT